MAAVYRAEVLGSLLRPAYLTAARAEHEAGTLLAADFKRIEDRAVDQAIALQEGLGLDVISDGELRRFSFFDQWIMELEGVNHVEGGDVVQFQGDAGEMLDFVSPAAVTEKIRRKRMGTVEEFAYARSRARVPVKVTVPSPVLIWFLWSPQHSRDAYPDIFDLFAEAADLVRDESRALAALGCTYIQIDAPDLGTLADPAHVAQRAATGQPLDRLLTEGVELVNAAADVPGVTFGLHLCKGNFASKWISAGGYDSIAEAVFRRCTNYDVFLLEYEDERSGSFEPLRHVPDDKVVSLGLVSSKTSELEPVDQVVARIDEAAKHFPKDQLSVSTQCGFASVTVGANLISEETQEAKLKLVAEVAERVWG